MSRRFIADCLDLAAEQGWRTERTANGWKFMPPLATARPGYEIVFVREAESGPHSIDITRGNLRRAGLKFPEDNRPKRSEKPMTPRSITAPAITMTGQLSTQPVPAPPAATDDFDLLNRRLEAAFNEIAEAQVIAARIRSENDKYRQFAKLAREIGIGK